MKKYLLAAAAAVALLSGGYVIAQTLPTPTVLSVSPTDLFADVVGGSPAVGNHYASGYQISGTQGYKDGGIAVTAWAYTFTAGQTLYVIRPAGTLATGALTTEANPGDGQRECFMSSQTQSALTWTANTGQTIGSGVPTAGVANTLQCIVYEAGTATWFRAQ